VANDYDSFAEAYSAGNEVSLLNAYYLIVDRKIVAGYRLSDRRRSEIV
jgi:hypothetical protein